MPQVDPGQLGREVQGRAGRDSCGQFGARRFANLVWEGSCWSEHNLGPGRAQRALGPCERGNKPPFHAYCNFASCDSVCTAASQREPPLNSFLVPSTKGPKRRGARLTAWLGQVGCQMVPFLKACHDPPFSEGSDTCTRSWLQEREQARSASLMSFKWLDKARLR